LRFKPDGRGDPFCKRVWKQIVGKSARSYTLYSLRRFYFFPQMTQIDADKNTFRVFRIYLRDLRDLRADSGGRVLLGL
jgi:hypothetical protein